MCRAVQPRFSAESGFWKTIWIERLSAVGRSADLRGERMVVELDLSRRRRGSRCRGSSWPASTCPSPTRRRARASRRRAAGGRRRPAPGRRGRTEWNVLETLLEVERHVALRDRGLADAGRRRLELADALPVVAARPLPVADRRRRADRPRGTGRSRAGSGRRTRRSAAASRSGAGSPGSSRAAARDLRMPWRGSDCSSPTRVRVLRALEDRGPRRPPRRSCRRTSPRPGRTSSG